MADMQNGSTMELRCYAYRRDAVWEAICTDLDVAAFGPSEEHVKRSLAEAIDLHLETVVGLPDQDRQAMLSRRAPWHVRLALELSSRVHDIRSKWRQHKDGGKARHSGRGKGYRSHPWSASVNPQVRNPRPAPVKHVADGGVVGADLADCVGGDLERQ